MAWWRIYLARPNSISILYKNVSTFVLDICCLWSLQPSEINRGSSNAWIWFTDGSVKLKPKRILLPPVLPQQHSWRTYHGHGCAELINSQHSSLHCMLALWHTLKVDPVVSRLGRKQHTGHWLHLTLNVWATATFKTCSRLLLKRSSPLLTTFSGYRVASLLQSTDSGHTIVDFELICLLITFLDHLQSENDTFLSQRPLRMEQQYRHSGAAHSPYHSQASSVIKH